MRSKRRGLLVALYGILIAGSVLLGRQFLHLEANLHGFIVAAIVLYILVATLPFVPAAEIGLSLMLMFGAEMAVFVYASTVLALILAYLAGRAVPARACAAALGFFGLRKAQELVLESAALDTRARLELILARAPARVVSRLLRHRYLALALALNLPGNTLLGGGGGIALSAGLSRLYSMPAYLTTVALAVAPVPLLIALSALVR